MKRTYTTILASFVCGIAGCRAVESISHVDEAADLAEKRLDQRPKWSDDVDTGTPSPGGELTLEAALMAALRNNRALRADLETIGQANADLVQAGLMSNPVINFMLMLPSGGGRAMLRANALPMQPLQDLWLIPARSDYAAAELQKAVLRVADRAVETAEQVKKAYADIQYGQRAVELVRANIELVGQSTHIIETSQQAGKDLQITVNLARIRKERLASDLLTVQTQLLGNKYVLLRLMGAPGASVDWSVAPPDEAGEKLSVPPAEEQAVLLAGDQRLDLKAAEWNTESALRRITLTKREGWPDLALGFTFERAPAARSTGPSLRARGFDVAAAGLDGAANGSMPTLPKYGEGDGPGEVKYTLGPMIEMEIPIFDWNQAQTARAGHEYRQRMAEYDALLHEVVASVRQTISRQKEAYDQLQLFRGVILPAVERNLELARQSYVTGQSDLTIYLLTQEDAINTRYKMLEFLRAYHTSRAELERAVGGKLDFATVTSQPAKESALNSPEVRDEQ